GAARRATRTSRRCARTSTTPCRPTRARSADGVTASAADLFAPPRIEMESRPDGVVVLRSDEPLGEVAPSMAHRVGAGAAARAERGLAAQGWRGGGGGWEALRGGGARARADAVAQALLEHGLGRERPLLILSGTSLEPLVMLLGAFPAGVPAVPL